MGYFVWVSSKDGGKLIYWVGNYLTTPIFICCSALVESGIFVNLRV